MKMSRLRLTGLVFVAVILLCLEAFALWSLSGQPDVKARVGALIIATTIAWQLAKVPKLIELWRQEDSSGC